MPHPALQVVVLGPVELCAGGRPLRPSRPKAAELLVYLALHPEGARPERVWDALWPESAVNPALLHTTVSAARSALDAGSDGALRVDDARRTRLYRISGPVHLDWDRFGAHLRRGRPADALALVRGPPFSSTDSNAYQWAIGVRADIEAAIGAAAERQARRRLDHGDGAGARAAVRAGLRALPYDERLYRLLLHVARVTGSARDAAAVACEMRTVLGVTAP